MSETQNTETIPEGGEEEARFLDTVIQMKDFMTQREALRWAINNDAGTIAWLGKIIGTVLNGQEKTKDWGDGKFTRSFQFNGVFEMTRYSDGKTKQARSCYLPAVFADELEMVYHKLKGQGGSVGFSIEIGIESVDRPNTPYSWRVLAYGKQQVDLLASVRGQIPPRMGFRLQKAIAQDIAIEGQAETLDAPLKPAILPPDPAPVITDATGGAAKSGRK